MGKEQIEEMAKVIKSSLDGLGRGNFNFTGDEISTMFAKSLYNACYRKQRVGEWVIKDLNDPLYESKKAPHCSNCGYMSFITWDYCPNCGAKMKGGAEG